MLFSDSQVFNIGFHRGVHSISDKCKVRSITRDGRF